MSEWGWWAIHIVPWVPVTLVSLVLLVKATRAHRLLLKIELQLNGNGKPTTTPPA